MSCIMAVTVLLLLLFLGAILASMLNEIQVGCVGHAGTF